MSDVMKKRIIGAIVLVVVGILLPLLLARCMQHDNTVGNASTRVYEITREGESRLAGADDDNVHATDASSESADQPGQDIDGASGVREARNQSTAPEPPEAVSPSATPDTDLETSPTQSNTSNAQGSANIADTAAQTPPSDEASSPDSADTTSAPEPSLRLLGSEGSGWVVQVASFGDEENAQRLAEQLIVDYSAYYRPGTVNGKTWYRVRVGPFDSESQAQTAAAKLRGQGRSTLVQRAK